MKFLGPITLALCLGACSTVTIREKGTGKLSTEPTYSDSKSYFLWGIVGEKHVDVVQVCNGKMPRQMQAQSTFLDSFLSTITLGIYYPRTAKVWCQ